MGTVVSFLVEAGDLSDRDVDEVLDEACGELHRLDDRFSPWKVESELSLLRAGRADTSSALMDEVFELCAHASNISQGFFDPWRMPGGFDPTGLVKGWAAERALSIIARGGTTAALVNAGGDICVLPGRTYQVGIRHPLSPNALCAVVPTTSAIATSGTYERGDHLIHPFGGEVAAVSATVTGDRLAIVDALATALAVGGTAVLQLLEAMDGVEGFFIGPTGSMFKTSNMIFSEVDEPAL
ncbi:MAG TPA: FAD:protein FMN transferase [Acidimicrobiales bacterium]|nr:FAD:protein FMN transferase [Acidimicrobiales bacterium]